jgi:subtilisin-like proprotein convertase family protein
MKFKSFFSRMGKRGRQVGTRTGRPRSWKITTAHVGLEELEARNLPQATLPPVTVYNQAASGAAGNVSNFPGLPLALVNNENTFMGTTQSPLSGLSPSVAVDPINPQKVVAVASTGTNAGPNVGRNGYVVLASADGGYSWTVVAPGVATTAGNLIDPQIATAGNNRYAQNTDATVTFDRSEQFYIVMDEHNAAYTSGALVLEKFDFSGASPTTITPVVVDNVLYKWDNTDAAYNPTIAIDNNLATYTDPQTHLVQTDSLATMTPATAAGTANLSGGQVSSVTLTAGGFHYSTFGTIAVDFTSAPGDPGTGAAGHAIVGTNGVVVGVVIDNPGTGYLTPPTVTFPFNGPPVPKDVYVAWNTVNQAPTNTDPRFPGANIDMNGVGESGTSRPNPSLIELMASQDGGASFTTPEKINDDFVPGFISADYYNPTTPTASPQPSASSQIVFTQGTSNGSVAGGEMAVVWSNLGLQVANNGAKTGGGFFVDTTRPDSGIPSRPAGVGYVAAGDLTSDNVSPPLPPGYPPPVPGQIVDGQLPPPSTTGAANTNDIAEATSFPVTIDIGDPNFVLDDLSVSMAMFVPHLDQMSVVLEAPDGTTRVTLINNYVDSANQQKNINGQRATGLPDSPNLGIDNGTVPQNNGGYNPFQVSDVTFDQQAARVINEFNAAPHYMGYFRPDDLGAPSQPGAPGVGLNGFQGWTPNGDPVTGAHALNGTWHLIISDFINDRLGMAGMTPNFNQFLDNWSMNITGYINTAKFGVDNPVLGLDTLTHFRTPNNDIPGSATDVYPDIQPVAPTTGIGPTFSVAVDNTLGSFSPHQGRIYVAATVPDHLFSNLTPGGQLIPHDSNIEMVYSDDGGATWLGNGGVPTPAIIPLGFTVATLPTIRISDDTTTDGTEGSRSQLQPKLSVDPTTGTVVATYLDARHDAATARVVESVEYSIDGGQTWSPSTYLNPSQVANDAVTGATDVVGPIPTNIGLAGSLGVGDRQGLAVYGGNVYAFWSGNYNTAGATNNGLNTGGFVISSARATIPAGPRVISGDQGPVIGLGSTGTYNNTFTSDGTRQITAFEVSLDRPVDPSTVNANSLQVSYRNPTTPTNLPSTDISNQITGVTPLNLDTSSNLASISIGNTIVLEATGGAKAVFPVFLTTPLGTNVPLAFTVTDITARAGVNYASTGSGAVTILAGSQTAFITIPILYDPSMMGNETFAVNLLPPVGVNVELHRSQGIATIVDANAARNLGIGDGIALKASGGTGMVFTVVLNQAYFQDVTVHWSTSDGTAIAGSDYVASSGTVTVPAGQTTAQFVVPLINNGVFGDNKTFNVTIDTPPVGITISRPQATGTIVNDTTIFPLSIYVGDAIATKAQSGLTNILFPVVLSIPQQTEVVATYSTQDNSAAAGRDYLPVTNGTVLFQAGQTTATITVQVIGSIVQEGNRDFFVNITGVSPTSNPITGLVQTINIGQSDPSLAPGQARGTIVDSNLDPALTIGNTTAQALSTGTTSITFPVYLSIPSTQPVTFSYATLDGNAVAGKDYTAASGSITVAPGQTSATITVQVLADQKIANDLVFFVNIFGGVGATIARPQAVGTIVDSPLGISIGDASVANPNTGMVPLLFPVYLNGTTTNTVTVDYTTATATAATNQAKAGTDYGATNGTLTFAPGQTSATITVMVDGTYTQAPSNLVFFVNLSNPVNANVLDSQAVGTIVDNNAVPTLTVGNVVVQDGDTGDPPQNALVPVYLSFPVPQDVTVNYTTTDGTGALGAKQPTDYTKTTGALTIKAGTSSATITVPIKALNSFEEPNLTFTVNLGMVTTKRTGTTLPNAVVAPSPPAPATPVNYGVGTVTIVHDGVAINVSEAINADGTLYLLNPGLMPPRPTVAVFTVTLSGYRSKDVTFSWSTADGTGVAGTDYTAVTNAVGTIPMGQLTTHLSVTILHATTTQSAATFFVNLTLSPTSNVDPRPTVSKLSGEAIIYHTDANTAMPAIQPQVSIGNVTQAEGNVGTSVFAFPVVINQSADVTVNYTVLGLGGAPGLTAVRGVDFVPVANGQIVFNTGGVQVQFINVNVIGNVIDNQMFTNLTGNRTFEVLLSEPANNNQDINPMFGAGLGTIVDDDALTATISSPTVLKPQQGTASEVFTVLLSNTSPNAVLVQVSTANRTALAPFDYAPVTNQDVIIAPGSISATFTVTVNGNPFQEGNTQYVVNAPQANAVGVYLAQDKPTGPANTLVASVLGTIVDQNTLALTIGDTAGVDGPVGTTNTLVFPVYLNAVTTSIVSVNYATQDYTAVSTGTTPDYTPATGTLMFSPGTTVQYITVTVNGQAMSEPNKQFTINLSQSQGAGVLLTAHGTPGNPGVGIGTIVNDNLLPAVTVGDATVPKGPAGNIANEVFPVYLSYPVSQDITVPYSTQDNTATVAAGNYVPVTNGMIVIPHGQTSAFITVLVNGASHPEGNEQFYLNLFPPFTGKQTTATLTRTQATGFIVDTNGMPTANIGDVMVDKPSSGTTNMVFPVLLSSASPIATSVQYATQDLTAIAGTNYLPTSGTLVFAAGQVVNFITVTVLGNSIQEGTKFFTINLSTAFNMTVAKPQGLGTIIDDTGRFGGASDYLVSIKPQSQVGTYSYAVGPFISDRIRTDVPSIAALPGTNATVYAAGPSQVNLPVPSSALGMTTSTMTITGVPAAQVIRDLTVNLSVAYPIASHLQLQLIAPDSTTVDLSDFNPALSTPAAGTGAPFANYFNTTFDDRAGLSVTDWNALPPFNGSFRPNTPLSALDGISPNGTWTLMITTALGDPFNPPPGVLQNWSMSIQTGVMNAAGSNGNFMDQNGNGLTADQTRNGEDLFATPEPANGVPVQQLPNPVTLADGTLAVSTASNPFQLPYAPNSLPLIIPGPSSTPLTFFPSPNPGSLAMIPNPVPLNLTIPAAPNTLTPSVVTSTINISGVPAGQVLTHLAVTVSLDHTQVSNLELTLIAPDGVTKITLSNRNPIELTNGSLGTILQYLPGANFDNVTFDDNAPLRNGVPASLAPANGAPASGFFPPYVGEFLPDSPLSVLDGKSLNGTWTLQIQNFVTAGPDGHDPQGVLNIGSLLGWSIQAQQGEILNANASSVDVNFSELINPATFKTTNVLSIMGPLGPVSLTDPSAKSTLTITPLLPNGAPDPSLNPAPEHSFRITFPTQTASGNYSVQIGPNPANGAYIQSTSGNAVDQNLNAGMPTLQGQDTTSGTRIPITFSTTDLPKPQAPVKLIPGGPLALMPITVPNNFVIQGAKVTVNIATTYDQALQAVLYAPDGTAIPLFTNVGSGPVLGQSGFQNTTLDDAAATPIQQGVTPFNTPPGSYKPQKPLSVLNGKGSKGTWYLAILDAATVRQGSTVIPNTPGQINNWSLTLLESPTPNTGLGEPVADQVAAGFQVFDADPSSSLSTKQWTPVGPASNNQNDNSGRITALAVDPSDPSGNTVFAGAASGGIWKTTNFMTSDPNGPNWVPLTDFGPTFSLNIGSIVIIPKNSDPLQSIIIAGTGEGNTRSPGVGFLRSPDGGRTWQVLDSLNNIDPKTGQVASINSPSRDHNFVGTTSFQLITDIPDPAKFPSSPVILYAAFGNTPTNTAGLPSSNNGGIYRSTNLGNTWTRIQAGDATSVALAAGSAGPNGNALLLYAGVDGLGVVFSPNAPVAANMTLLPTPGNVPQQDNLIQNDFNYPLGPSAAILPVANPATTPSGAPGGVTPEGRVTIAVPKATGQPLLDSFYQSWIYAVVATPGAGGSTNGLYMSKDFGRTWTQVPLPIVTQGNVFTYNTNDFNQPNWDPLSHGDLHPNANINYTQANYSTAITVDPSNPNIVYLGGEGYGVATGGLVRIDTTNINDPYNLVPYSNSSNDGGLAMFRSNGAVAKYEPQNFPMAFDTIIGLADPYDLPPFTTSIATEQYTGENPITLTGGYVNAQRNPENPFITFSTIRVEGYGQPSQPPAPLPTTGFFNTGQGTYWQSFEALPELLGNNSYFSILAVPDQMTGGTRLILGTALGVYTQEANIDAGSGLNSGGGAGIGSTGGVPTLTPNIGSAFVANGSRNGDIQVTQLFYGAVQPSELASELAQSLFYGSARENGTTHSSGNPLDNGSLDWTGSVGDAAGVQTDQTGSGTLYQYLWPTYFINPGSTLAGGVPSDFFEVTPPGGSTFSATNGLVTGISDPSNNAGLWPEPRPPVGFSYVQAPGGANFAINPVNGQALAMGSPGIPGQANTSGWIFLTTSGGNNWFPIAQPTDIDSTYAQATAFGAPNPSDPPGSLDNFIYAGTVGGHVFVTFTAGGVGTAWKNITGGAFGSAGALDGSAVQQIVPDPNRGSHDLFAITLNGVYYMADSTALNPTWTNITGNLFTTALSRPIFNDPAQAQNTLLDMAGFQNYLTSLAVDWRYAIPNDPTKPNGPTHPILYVAGEGGVFRSLDDGKSWTTYPATSDGAVVNGGYLPYAHVTSLSLALGNIDPNSGLPLNNTPTTQGTGFNMLVASTYGRGQFEIRLNNNAVVNGQPVSKFLVSTEKVQGPYVTSAGLVTNAAGTAVTGINVTFSGAIDPSTFTVGKVKQVIGPAGNAVPIIGIADISTGGAGANLHNAYQIQFATPQTAVGVYTVTLGPNISDFGGTLMDQNRNGTPGEAVGDDFSGAFNFGNATPAPPVQEVVARIQNNGQWWVGTPNGTNGLTFTQFGQWAVDSPGLTWVNVHTGDLLGNGTQDIVGMVAQTGQWWVGISNGDHFTNQLWATWAPYSAGFQWQDVVFGDFNGDGKMDIAGRESGNGRWWVALSTGSAFQTSSWTVWAPNSANLTWTNVVVGDFNGDGKADIAGMVSQSGQWWVAQSTGTSFTNKLWTTWAANRPGTLDWVDVQVGDFNGDGKSDIVGRLLENGQWWLNVSQGSSFTPVLWDAWSPAVKWSNVQVADINGDGRADIIGRDPGSNMWVSLSTGAKGSTSLWASWGADALGNFNWETDLLLADLNGDGKKDLIGWDQALDQWWVSLANPGGTAFGPRALWASFPGNPSFNLLNVTTAHVR